jgi:hypothetical protein
MQLVRNLSRASRVEKILSLYALGMSYEAIGEHLNDLYGLEVSPANQ